ncbi:hypothetical protein [Natronolimnobius baerhuensis]|uniref:Uncharacterized protein n=1 Tax=Natronolimnobius baerhuensis TaxID=253108 RepID=A0A202E6F6_9EURY|nr:hypothetical protein [Natronolimnobius baerhuensis]OVE83853.1 hypothetical protein B2G88_15675 [Natronolimnobius baerhuensis]
MKNPGILWMLQTAAGFSMAGPMFVVGLEFVRTGRTAAGIGFFAMGAFALYLPTFLVNRFTGRVRRIGGPRTWVARRLGRTSESESDQAADDPSEADSRSGAQTGETDSRHSSPSLLERLRRR